MKIFGVHPVEEILRVAPHAVQSIFAARWDAAELAEVRSLCESNGLTRQSVDRAALDELAEGGNHQGVLCEIGEFEYAELGELLEQTSDLARACVLVLDQVQDPHNLGAILRTAAAMGVRAVIVPKDRAASVTPSVIRASAGQAFRVPVIRVTNIARTLDELRDNGWWSVGTFMDGATDVREIDFGMKAAIVMGGEHQGIRRLVAEKCDFRARIPMSDDVESLNVSVAAAILMYEATR